MQEKNVPTVSILENSCMISTIYEFTCSVPTHCNENDTLITTYKKYPCNIKEDIIAQGSTENFKDIEKYFSVSTTADSSLLLCLRIPCQELSASYEILNNIRDVILKTDNFPQLTSVFSPKHRLKIIYAFQEQINKAYAENR